MEFLKLSVRLGGMKGLGKAKALQMKKTLSRKHCALPMQARSVSITVPNLKRIAQFVQKLLRESRNLEIRSRDPGHVHLGVVLWSLRREALSMSVPN